MQRSKLEIYVDVLKILASRGPMRLNQLMHKMDLNRKGMKLSLKFLKQQYLVEEHKLSKIFYVITERGLKVLNVVLPIIMAEEQGDIITKFVAT